ncbi:MAG: hypothetical protein NZM38_07790 [Cytophagales bacterium]|nr:hypothetical protein [Cytophagales bacterium]MDW8384658.1 hypothetical protein [Flammeovirgaceae bacterium]
MFVDFALVGLVAALMIPTLSGYYAYTHGRSFWLWFGLGICFPVVSYIILLILPDKSDNAEAEIQKLRLQLGLLGTKSEIAYHDRSLRKALQKPKNKISFEVRHMNDYVETEIIIDGKNLKEILFVHELNYALREKNSLLACNYRGLPPEVIYLPSRHLLGEPIAPWLSPARNPLLYIDKTTGNPHTWALAVRIEEYSTYVVWRCFWNVARIGKWKYDKLGIFVFNKLEYLSALETLEKKAKQLNL